MCPSRRPSAENTIRLGSITATIRRKISAATGTTSRRLRETVVICSNERRESRATSPRKSSASRRGRLYD